MEASVLPLSWPADFDPLDHKRFETDARILRYQALGRACHDAGIHSLMVAHHADDQAETVLMRFASGRLRLGLQAMKPTEWIPECHGLHGISHSGVVHSSFENRHLEHLPFPVESGGVRILRPLLDFSKARLLATCKYRDVAWADDKTNDLQTYTSRNAVRHMMKHYKLPAALSIQSLVEVSSHMQQRVATHKEEAERLFHECKIQLDIQAGSLLVRFPSFRRLIIHLLYTRKPTDSLTQSDLIYVRNSATYLLARVAQLVSPREDPPLAELAASVGNIWPEFQDLEETELTGTRKSTFSYCVYGVWWRKWAGSIGAVEEEGKRSQNNMDWYLTRQPKENRPGKSEGIVYPPSHIIPITQPDSPAPSRPTSSDFRLFDNRWWINIKNNSTDELRLRFFTKDDYNMLRAKDTEKRASSRAFTALSLLTTADLRINNLPAIFRVNAETGTESFVGFPTLNVSRHYFGPHKNVCTWRVRYKKIHLGAKDIAAIVVPGVTRELIEDKEGKLTRSLANRKPRDLKRAEWVEQNKKKQTEARERARARMQEGIPLVPFAESKRKGRSEKRGDGGYDIKWEDVGDRL
jgi:tRNA(Ile)-lysidine synthase